MKSLKSFIPILEWLPSYKAKDLKGDVIAGITVGVMLIPQGMAYAMLAGLPPIFGLYASIVPLVLYAIFGTSRQLAVGPVAMVSLLVATGIGALATDNVNDYISLSILLSFLVGSILLLMGLLRLGFLVNFLSHPVILGFTFAAALIIATSQLKHLLGVEIERSEHIHHLLSDAFTQLPQVNILTLSIGFTAMVLIMMIKKFKFKIPGSLLAVILGIVSVWAFDLDELGVKIIGSVPAGLPSFNFPSLSWDSMRALFPTALTIAIIGFLESFAVAKAVQSKRKNYMLRANQEMIALGVSNIGGSLFQAFPTVGGFSRTAINDQSGANTGLASIFSALMITLTLLFLTPIFYYLPKAILAAVIIVAVFGLIDIKEAKYLWNSDRNDFWLLVITFVATLILGIEGGILLGVILSLAMVIYQSSRPHIAELAKIPGESNYRNIERFESLEIREDVLIVRFDARLYFANVNALQQYLKQRMNANLDRIKAIILDAESINSIDSTGMHALEEILESYRSQGQQFFLTGLKGPIRDQMQKAGFLNKIGKENLFICIQDAIDYFDNKLMKNIHEKYVLQTNYK